MTDSQALGFLLMDTSFAWKCQGTAEKACQRKTTKRPAQPLRAGVSRETDV